MRRKWNTKWPRFSTADEKKADLLAMARAGVPRPSEKRNAGSWASVFFNYVRPKSRYYDARFAARIRAIRPDWFETFLTKAKKKKRELLRMARAGEPKPHYSKNPLGIVFSCYVTKSQSGYDAKFTAKIRALRPDWFETHFTGAAHKKAILLRMAKSGAPRPTPLSHPLGRCFNEYLNPASSTYDRDFGRNLKKVRPDWLETLKTKCKKKKATLLRMARNGAAKPVKMSHPLTTALRGYVNPSQPVYDAEFTRKIKKLRPDWFSYIRLMAARKKGGRNWIKGHS
jgi:hypothetical protein